MHHLLVYLSNYLFYCMIQGKLCHFELSTCKSISPVCPATKVIKLMSSCPLMQSHNHTGYKSSSTNPQAYIGNFIFTEFYVDVHRMNILGATH